jgi:hypothetical protein
MGNAMESPGDIFVFFILMRIIHTMNSSNVISMPKSALVHKILKQAGLK